MARTIGFLGSLALLVSGLTGPSLIIIPLLFQQAGWLTPLLAFALIAFLTGSATLFIIETMASIEGNEEFQASIEFTTIAHLFLGKRWHWAVQIILYVALEALIITSLIESFQSMDSLLISLAHKTCAISFEHGWICANRMLANGSGVFTDYIVFSFGTLIAFVLILPLSLIHLTDNIKFQVASFILLLCIAVVWIATCIQVGLHNVSIPVVGSNQSNVVGFVLSNFAFVTTIPAWINNTHPSVNVHLVIWLALFMACLIYIPIGWMGAVAFSIDNNGTILNVISSDRPNIVALISTYIFPVAVLITSVPVFAIVVRYNLLRGDICSTRMAIFLSAVLPWLFAIPFQTRGWIAIILNWTSLVFSSPANLLIPFLLYLVSKRYKASALLDPNVSSVDNNTEVIPLQESEASVNEQSTEAASVIGQSTEATSVIEQSTEAASVNKRSTEAAPLLEPATVIERPSRPPLPLLQVSNLEPETDDYIRRVRSPSKHRYYGQDISNVALPDSPLKKDERDAFLVVPGSPSSPRSSRRTSTGTDEFRLLPITVTPVKDRQSTLPTTAITENPEETPIIVIAPVSSETALKTFPPVLAEPALETFPPVSAEPAFEAFPFLRRSSWWSWCTPSRVATVEGGITFLLVGAAFVDSIIQSIKS